MNRATAGLVYHHLQDFQKNWEALNRSQAEQAPELPPVENEGRTVVGTGG